MFLIKCHGREPVGIYSLFTIQDLTPISLILKKAKFRPENMAYCVMQKTMPNQTNSSILKEFSLSNLYSLFHQQRHEY